MLLVDHYKNELRMMDPHEARKSTVLLFHRLVKESFERMSGLSWPLEARDEEVTNTEQAALRAMHDILPGKILLFGRVRKSLNLTNFLNAKIRLTQKELDQNLKDFDGDYDDEYKNIKIPFSKKIINLKQIDADFIKKFSPYRQEDMLKELSKLGTGGIRSEDVFFMHHFFELVSKGICSNNNIYIPKEINCF